MKKRLGALLLSVALVLFLLPGKTTEAKVETNLPTRVVNLVFDDSGSMYEMNKKSVDTWCQAKYSLEVFAALMGEKDTVNVYYLSDFAKTTKASPRFILSGRNSAQNNVDLVHNETTTTKKTYFNAVRGAYNDLLKAAADEKWLVVLTDGEFEEGKMPKSDVEAFFKKKEDDINIMYLAIGSEATPITQDAANNIFSDKAETSKDILNKITTICTRVFNMNRLEVNNKTISFDIPMAELIVFAQGANVEINGIVDSSNRNHKYSSFPVIVKYSECDAKQFHNKPDTSLLGKLAPFKDNFDPGTYTLDVTGAETIDVFYKPNIEIDVALMDSENNVVTTDAIEIGEYIIDFYFVKGGTKERVISSKLLGEFTYTATVTNAGTKDTKTYYTGDKVKVDAGEFILEVVGSFLEYNTVSSTATYTVYKNKEVTFEVINDPVFTVDSNGIKNLDYVEVVAKLDGELFTEDQWAQMSVPSVSVISGTSDFDIENPTVEKTETPSYLRIYPSLPNGTPSTGTYSDFDYEISLDQQAGKERWSGSVTNTMQMSDIRPWLERYWDLMVTLGSIASAVALAMGYVPGIKKYLPKNIKFPLLRARSKTGFGKAPTDGNGDATRLNLFSSLCPYASQTAEIKFLNDSAERDTGVPSVFKVKAMKNDGAMKIVNANEFADHPIKIGATRFRRGEPMRLYASDRISVEGRRYNWNITFNSQEIN